MTGRRVCRRRVRGLPPLHVARDARRRAVQLSWTLTNRSDEPLPVPNDLTFEAQHVFIDVADANGVPSLGRRIDLKVN